MHVRVRLPGKPEAIIVVDSKLTKIETFRLLIEKKFDIAPELQRLFYGGKVLEDGYTFHDYTIKLNDVVQLMPKSSSSSESNSSAETSDAESIRTSEKRTLVYEDAKSVLYRIGEYVDAKDPEIGAWFEGKIVRIVKDPNSKLKTKEIQSEGHNEQDSNEDATTSKVKNGLEKSINGESEESTKNEETVKDSAKSAQKKATPQPKTPKGRKSKTAESPVTPKRSKGITDYFNRTPKSTRKSETNGDISINGNGSTDDADDGVKSQSGASPKKPPENGLKQADDYGILYEVELEDGDENQFCKLDEIRPRARTELNTSDLTEGMTVLVNHNLDEPNEKGFWYDFTIWDIKNGRKGTELIGTLFLGRERIPQDGTKVHLHQQAFKIESVVPIEDRTPEYDKMMITTMEKSMLSEEAMSVDDECDEEEDFFKSSGSERDFGSDDDDLDPDYCPGIGPLNCSACRDDAEQDCRECGCHTCAGKENPEKIVLCDECNDGFHMSCLNPPLTSIPNEDWYCPECKRSPDEVIAPGGPRKQKKKANKNTKSTRDWGRGMACVGKTQSCAMPANHFGPIPGVEVGMTWRFRIQLSESGVHRPPVSGIHGRDVEGAYSLVLSGGYEDDVDNGFEFTYTGSGGRDLSGNKRTADQSSDQTLTRENKALARNCAVPEVSEKGGDAKAKWRDGKPVRVVRSYKLVKHCPKYAPKEGIRYDGIYKVVKYYPETGKSGFKVWKYLLRRDDPNLAPWQVNAKQYQIVYPDGYLEAEAEKQALKGIKKAPKESEPAKDKKTPNKKKRVLQETNSNGPEKAEEGGLPPAKKARRLTRGSLSNGDRVETPKAKAVTPKRTPKEKSSKAITPKRKVASGENPFAIASRKTKGATLKENSPEKEDDMAGLRRDESDAIGEDTLNSKLWDDCLAICKSNGRKQFISHVTEVFKCIICQDVVSNPVTTKCQHNFCKSCLKLAFKSTETQVCSYCRQKLNEEDLEVNDKLRVALRTIMPGYDVGKK